jgi:hypothetical protein
VLAVRITGLVNVAAKIRGNEKMDYAGINKLFRTFYLMKELCLN